MRAAQWRIVLFPAIVVIAWSTASRCGDAVPHGYRAIAAEFGIPYTVLYAVALAESGLGSNGDGVRRPWPWTLNVAGRPHVYATREAAWHALNVFIAGGERSIDIGLMQVNWRFHHEALGDSWQALDPYHNLRVGAAILQDCFARRHDWWAGVGCYHSPGDVMRAQQYRLRVVGQWRRLAIDG